jgi:hypothetical protein
MHAFGFDFTKGILGKFAQGKTNKGRMADSSSSVDSQLDNRGYIAQQNKPILDSRAFRIESN